MEHISDDSNNIKKNISCENHKEQEIFDIISSAIGEVFDMLNFNVFVIDEDGVFRYVNKEYCRVRGLPKEEIVGKSVKEVLPEYLVPSFDKGKDSLLSQREEYKDTQRFISPDGTQHLFNTKKNIIPEGSCYYKSFQILGKNLILGTGVDVIDFEKTENKLKEKIDELERTEKRLKYSLEKLEERHRQIRQSIDYGERIQKALFPNELDIQSCIPDSFLIHKPKSTVSGDFYWFHKTENDEIIIAIGDCTGHGIPGAFMSILGISSLNSIVKDQRITNPEYILRELNQSVARDLNTKREKCWQDEIEDSNDGMDISICNINLRTRKLTVGLAKGIVYLAKDGEIEKLKGNRYPIGADNFYEEEKTFKNHTIDIQGGETIYMLTDGYTDQFRFIEDQENQDNIIGPNQKKPLPKTEKFQRSRLKDIFGQIQGLTLNQQMEVLEKTFYEWKGKHKQIDDVLIFGGKIPELNGKFNIIERIKHLISQIFSKKL